jgi:tyrosinase-like protein/repeat uncharacterized protein DUF346
MSHRRDLNSLSATERTTLRDLMLTYINDAVVWSHNPDNPNAIVHHMGEHAFITHRNFIGDLEAWLTGKGGAMFVPLPAWSPANPIPTEFNVVKPQDDGTARPGLVNLNPNVPKPAVLAPPGLCGITDAEQLWDNEVDGWHGTVHVTIGGTMGDIHIAPAAPIFFCWHGYVDEIYDDWLRCRWSGWEDLGGVITSGVGAASWDVNRLDCFAKGQDNHMWHKWWDGSAWSGWEDLGGVIDGTPAAVSWGPNRIDCFARGMDNHMWHKWWDGSAWSGWEDIGGVISAGPAAASWASNRLDGFAKGGDNALWYKWIDVSVVHNHAGTWSGWHQLGGIIDDEPGAVSWGPSRIDMFARGMDNHMWHKWWTL